ncbi:MAG TPA: phosphatase PAP2 family protein [Caulobacteraceae bacterium]|nr:phosphatase PAP2 family protein [Caulobacteraceae bacterium]
MAAVAGAVAPALWLRRSLAENGLLAGLMAAYVGVCTILAAQAHVAFSLGIYKGLWLGAAIAVAAVAVFRAKLPAAWRLPERFVLAAPVLLVGPAFFSAFTSMKSGIAHFHPYDWDPILAAWDRRLLGDDAWRLLQPAFDKPPVTFLLSVLYSAWHPAMVLIFGGLVFSLGNPRLRAQALIALVGAWTLLGTWAATLLASVGPCFAGPLRLGDGAAFAAQAAYLRQADQALPIWEFAEQGRLLSAEAMGTPIIGSGISAMPSMHIAVAMLMMLVGWRSSRLAGVIGTAYLAVIVVASIHLGWHYAVDGLAAMAGAGAIWWVSGQVAKRIAP